MSCLCAALTLKLILFTIYINCINMTRSFNHSLPWGGNQESIPKSGVERASRQAGIHGTWGGQKGRGLCLDWLVDGFDDCWFRMIHSTFQHFSLSRLASTSACTSVASLKVQENFIKIQEAYELLSDATKRKQYDSSLDFDEMLGCASFDSMEVCVPILFCLYIKFCVEFCLPLGCIFTEEFA